MSNKQEMVKRAKLEIAASDDSPYIDAPEWVSRVMADFAASEVERATAELREIIRQAGIELLPDGGYQYNVKFRKHCVEQKVLDENAELRERVAKLEGFVRDLDSFTASGISGQFDRTRTAIGKWIITSNAGYELAEGQTALEAFDAMEDKQ